MFFTLRYLVSSCLFPPTCTLWNTTEFPGAPVPVVSVHRCPVKDTPQAKSRVAIYCDTTVFLPCSPDPVASSPADTEHAIQSPTNKSQRVYTRLPLGLEKNSHVMILITLLSK